MNIQTPCLLFCMAAMALSATTPLSAQNRAQNNADEASSETAIYRIETNLGDIDIELYPEKAPVTAANFADLADSGFYDGIIFHRVAANYVIQAGGYDKNLEYRTPPGTIPNESSNGLLNLRGSLSMARLVDPDSAESQFFINIKHNKNLDPQSGQPGYTVFAHVVAGMDVVEEIELVDTSLKNGMAGVPDQPVIIRTIRIVPASYPKTES